MEFLTPVNYCECLELGGNAHNPFLQSDIIFSDALSSFKLPLDYKL